MIHVFLTRITHQNNYRKPRMRLAFVDLLFSWPPNGGADVDLFHVAQGLAQGHDVKLFGVHVVGSSERGLFDPEQLPFPAERLVFEPKQFNRQSIAHRIKASVDLYSPDVVVVCDAFLLKPAVILALARYPLAARYYAYEAICHKDILHFRNGAPCQNNYLETPEECRRCALKALAPEIKQNEYLAWTQEYLLNNAYAPEYYREAKKALQKLSAVFVYNDLMKEQLENHCRNIHVVPGGVDPEQFPYTLPTEKANTDKQIILMVGRAEDPAKGADVLQQAGKMLWQHRQDFEIQMTLPEGDPVPPWMRNVGWRDHEETKNLYATADICVVPSIWDEPFGIVALEAMATGRPVCASRVGGLQKTIVHEETGYLFDRGDSETLATQLEALLDNLTRRTTMGDAGRKRVEENYTWQHIISEHYKPILNRLDPNEGV